MFNTLIKTVDIDEKFITFLDENKNVVNKLALDEVSGYEIFEAQFLFQKAKCPVLRTLFGNIFFGFLGGFLCGLTSLIPKFKKENIKFFQISSQNLKEDIIFSADEKVIKEIEKQIKKHLIKNGM